MNESKTSQLRCFIDTNIWLYAFIEIQDKQKLNIANRIITKQNILISVQVINEISQPGYWDPDHEITSAAPH
jgi:predicted nucleic acid-binding protein